MKYASIIPLIGGETIAMQNVFGKRPEYLLSYTPFKANDSQLVNYYKGEVPYYLLDENPTLQLASVDVVNSVCPCAGLSSLSVSSSSNNKTNDWMIESSKYVLSMIKPRVLWGENAPRLASKMGEPVVNRLRKIARDNGYTFSLYKTKSIKHGLSQVRDRTFYFFWKDTVIPHLPFYLRENEKIEDVIRDAFVSDDDPMNELANKTTPTNHPLYRYVLNELHSGYTHQDFQKSITKSANIMRYIESHGVSYDKVAEWMDDRGFEKMAKRCRAMHSKIKRGGNIMRKTVEIPKDYIGAFVGHYPTQLTHPDEDRFLTIRECLSIMKMPKDFMLQGGTKNINMICQSVPVTTAMDMAECVLKYLQGQLDTSMTDFLVQDNRNQTTEVEFRGNSLQEFF